MSDEQRTRNTGSQNFDWGGVAGGWQKWDAWLDTNLRAFNQLLIQRAQIGQGHRVLDLGSGTGYPAIPTARFVGSTGSVDGLDLSEEMLRIARRKADQLGLKNIKFQQCDVTSIPFQDQIFDAIISRFCLMFVPNVEQTLREAYRVLRKGGFFAASVWTAPERHPLPMSVIRQYVEVPAVDPSSPGMFRLSKPGDLKNRMAQAGFSDLQEEEVKVEEFDSSGREYVERMMDMGATVRPLLNQLTSEKLREVEDKLAEAAEKFRRGEEIYIPRVALVLSGIKRTPG